MGEQCRESNEEQPIAEEAVMGEECREISVGAAALVHEGIDPAASTMPLG